jgi:plasmid stabilization system protein ParE
VIYRLRVSRRAGRQIREASTWWLRHRDKAPLAFAEDLDDALNLIVELPNAGELDRRGRTAGVRRVLLTRTRYHLYYSVDESTRTVQVLSLWHTSRGTSPTLG